MRVEREKDEYEEEIGLGFNHGSKKIIAFMTNFKVKTYIDI